MNQTNQTEELTRARIVQLLTEGEVEGASIAEAKARLGKGDEYLDLQQLHQGVQRAQAVVSGVEHVLPRKAVHEDTWRRISRQLKQTPV